MEIESAILSLNLFLIVFFPFLVTVLIALIKKRKQRPINKVLIAGTIIQLLWMYIVFVALRGAASFLNTMG